ncbi:MAG: hypothetical protein JWP03_862 [Phycisphaerales bacterium]|nr:hypothetical protein [Phycisphaerales bacterium]
MRPLKRAARGVGIGFGKTIKPPGRGKQPRVSLAEALEERLALSASPSILSITRASPANSSTDATGVAYTVTFSAPVVGVAASDFTLALNGVTASAPLTVSGSGAAYTVAVNGIAGTGTLGVNFTDHDTVHDAAGHRLLRPNAPLAFGDPYTLTTSSKPQSIAVADLNRDGRLDIVSSGNPISVLLGNGDGTFTSIPIAGDGSNSPTIAVADVNMDSKPDLVTDFGVRLGNGDGTFQPLIPYFTGPYPSGIAVADLNGDNRPDVIVGDGYYNGFRMFLGNGDGSFKPSKLYATSGAPAFFSAVDINSDNFPDLVAVSSFNGYVSVSVAKGDGTFQPQQNIAVGASFHYAGTADVNGDTKPDLLLLDSSNWKVGIMLGNGDGTFQPPVSYATDGPNSLIAADVNGDGKLDLVVSSNQTTGLIDVLLGNGDGTFQTRVAFAVGTYPQAIAVGDFNGDGEADIVAGYQYQSNLTVLLGNMNDSYTGPVYTIDHPLPSVQSISRADPARPLIHSDSVTYTVTFTQPVTGVDPTDFALALNGTTGQIVQVTLISGAVYTVTIDGVSGSGTLGLNFIDDGSVHDLAGEGLVSYTGSFSTSQVLSTGPSPTYLAVADANRDGNPDVFTANSGNSTISEFPGNGDGTFQPPAPVAHGTSSVYSLYTADFNQDGKPDLFDGQSGAVILGNGDGTFQPPLAGTASRPYCIADVNGDGFPDLVFQGYQFIQVALGRGDGTFRAPVSIPVKGGTNFDSVSACDINQDGIVDLVADSFGVISVLLGRGDGTFQLASTYTSVFPLNSSVNIADVNHDGIPDVIDLDNVSQAIRVFLGNGDGTLQPPISTPAPAGRSTLALTDVNADGNIDAVSESFANTVVLLLGNGDGSFQPQRLNSITATSIAVADVNRDGRPDVIANNYYTNTAAVLLNGGNGDRTGDLYAVNSATPAVNPFVLTAGVEGTRTPAIIGSFTGQPQDAFTATADYGDGFGAGNLPLSGNNFTIANTYPEAGTYNVTVVVTDTTAGLVSAPFSTTITVSDAPIVATITGAPATITLGASVNLNFTATNTNTQETGPLVESWNIQDGSNTVVASGTGGPFTFTPTAAGTYTVNFSAGESAVADAETGTATATITVNPAAPTYLGTQVDDGNRQRSEVRSLTFHFSSPVTLGAGAITLARSNALGSNSGTNDGSAPTDASAALDLAHATTPDGGMSWVVPFVKSVAGFTDVSGSLVDDVYAATVHASLVTDSFGQILVGGDQVKNFHRLYGDVTGAKTVNNADFAFFSNTFGLTSGQAGYNRYFDLPGLGNKISNADFAQFSNRFGKKFVYTAN